MFIIVWSGPIYEPPVVFCTQDEEKAKSNYFNSVGDSAEAIDERVDVLRVHPDGAISRGRPDWVDVEDWLE